MNSATVRRSMLFAIGLTLAVRAGAAGVDQIASLSSESALQAATSAEDACLKMGFRVSVTVVDAAGNVLVTVRQDGAGPHTVSTSQRKAYTALSSRMPTTQLTRIVAASSDAFGMREIDGFLVLSGGIPIKSGETVVGAIGVSGSPGPDNDDKCAGAGIASIAGKLGK
ncbi:MAG TPA: heme-binding protein [Steroidobacteraceae bacterium]|nr:heme-binding protein [Steroidobacteraceae bacterium]